VDVLRGLIIIDTLIHRSIRATSLDLYFAHRPRKPVVAVSIPTSPDHYGGVSGVSRQPRWLPENGSSCGQRAVLEAVVVEPVTAATQRQKTALQYSW